MRIWMGFIHSRKIILITLILSLKEMVISFVDEMRPLATVDDIYVCTTRVVENVF